MSFAAKSFLFAKPKANSRNRRQIQISILETFDIFLPVKRGAYFTGVVEIFAFLVLE